MIRRRPTRRTFTAREASPSQILAFLLGLTSAAISLSGLAVLHLVTVTEVLR